MEKLLMLNSGKCSWGKCFACGWGRKEYPRRSIHELKSFIDVFFRKNKVSKLKIFCSGSFLDDKQFSKTIRKYLAGKCIEGKVKELIIESRPEHITDENLKDFYGLNLTVAIGLETADDNVLKKYNKGFTLKDFENAAKILKNNKCELRVYLMVGLPFVKNHKSFLKKEIEYVKKFSNNIVLINTFPHAAAPLFELWLSGKWKPLDKKQFEDIVKGYKYEKDFNNFSFIPRFPRDRQTWIKGATEKELLHPFFELWQDYFVRFYERPKEKNIAVFVPCSFRKPYFKSKTHKEILRKLKPRKDFGKMHLVVVSSPGVIPYEFADKYPFNKYDWPEWEETEKVKELYTKVTEKRIRDYLKKHKYKKYYSMLKEASLSYKALKKVKPKISHFS